MPKQDYNEKAFLLPDNPSSCAIYHAKTENGNKSYKLTINDCNHSIRLWGPLETQADRELALQKLDNLILGVTGLRDHIVNELAEKS